MARLTDQAAVAVALARSAAAPAQATVAHLLVGLVTESEGRAGRRLRERGSAAAALLERAAAAPVEAMEEAVRRAVEVAGSRATTTVDLLDAAIAAGGAEILALLEDAGYHRDLDGWLLGDPESSWFDDAETFGWSPGGNEALDAAASRVVAQVRAVGGGAVEVLIASAAAPDAGVTDVDPQALATAAGRWPGRKDVFNADIDTVVDAALTLRQDDRATVDDLVRAALVVGGEPVRWVLATALEDT